MFKVFEEKLFNSCFSKLLIIIGLYYFIKFIINFLQFIYKNFLLREQNLKEKYGDGWAIVTGSTDGIGLGFVEELLLRKYKVCLIARNEKKIKEKISLLQSKIPNSTMTYVVFDFNSLYTNEDINELKQKILKSINSEDISILVNNVGMFSSKKFNDVSENEMRELINVNITSHVSMTKILLPFMMKKNNKKSLILVSGSLSGRILQKKISLYCASKSYLEKFFKILNMEYSNIDVTVMEIGFVNTNMVTKTSIPLILSPNEAAVEGLKRAGRYDFTTISWKHDLINFAYWHIPFVAYFNQEQSEQKIKPKTN